MPFALSVSFEITRCILPRSEFEAAWRQYLPRCTDADFAQHRYQRAATEWKYSMWDVGCKMPTQTVDDRSRCFCGVEITAKSTSDHIRAHHMEGRMKFAEPRPYADPEKAARRIVEIASTVEPAQDGRIYVELINGTFLFKDKGSPAEYGAGMKLAIERGWLVMHESGTFVRFTPAGAELFA